MTSHIYRPEHKHPEPYQQDLNPDASKGLNWGLAGPHPEKNGPRTAYDVKELHRWLCEIPDDELKLIPILPVGARLEADAVYLDLADANRQEFKAEGKEDVREGQLIAPKSEVDFELWNWLRGETDPVRTGGRPKPR
jgi:hypothetical protein